ncbi:MAG: sulfatase-like hydrolase/transferase, partial [Opitutaceae bacterium]
HGAWLPAEQYFDTPLYHGDQLQAHKGFCTDVLFDEALAWIGARAKDAKNHEPFFAYVATNAGHTPLVAPESYTAPFLSQGFSKDDASYLGMIKNLDDNVGRLEALLDSAGLRANTLFVFLSDNGGQSARGVYNAGMRGRKRFYYEGGHRVPLFIRWPAGKLRSGRNVTDLTQVQDLLPTLIDLVGISVPSRTQFEGVSLAPVLRDEAQHLADRTLVVQYPRPNGGKGDAAVLWGRWRLVHDKELYNLDDDPGQTTDIAARHPEIVAKMRTHYERWWSRIEPGLQIKWPDRQKEEKPCYFPPPESEGGWRKLDKPEDIRRLAGMDPEKLADLEQWLLQSDKRDFAAVVIRNGYSVLEVERGNSAKTDTGNVKSVAKAICATVLAIASEQSQQGLTPKKMTFAAAAFDFLPWAKPLSDPRKARITVQQLLNHTSGLTPQSTGVRNEGPWERILGNTEDPKTARLAFDPGSDLDLSTHAFYHAALVCEDVTGLPYDTFAVQMLFEPLGVEKWSFEFFDGGDKIGKHPSHGLGLPARDIARIAYCMLHNGRWQDKQVVPGWFVNETGAPTHSVKGVKQHRNWDAESYTHGWLLPGLLTDGRGRDVPKDARFMPGSGGQLIAFVPSLDLVVARQTGGSGEWQSEEFLRRACAAISQETSACALQAARAHP